MDHNGGPQNAVTDSHGTYCASLIASEEREAEGVAPEANVLGIRVGFTKGTVSAERVAAGLKLALQKKVNVISCSFVLSDLGSHGPAIRDAVREAHLAGVPVVAAAGNDVGGTLSFPDFFPHSLVVSAHGLDMRPMAVRHNDWTDVFALGDDLDVLTMSGQADVWPGLTSGATALVSGVLALALAAVPKLKRARAGMVIDQLAASTATRGVHMGKKILRINPQRLTEAVLAI
jgi:subtilisin family serine protease